MIERLATHVRPGGRAHLTESMDSSWRGHEKGDESGDERHVRCSSRDCTDRLRTENFLPGLHHGLGQWMMCFRLLSWHPSFSFLTRPTKSNNSTKRHERQGSTGTLCGRGGRKRIKRGASACSPVDDAESIGEIPCP